MKKSEIIAEILRLPIANNGAVAVRKIRIEALATELSINRIRVRVGGYSRSGLHTLTYLYLTMPWEAEVRVAESVTHSGGFFQPISGSRFAAMMDQLSDALEPVRAAKRRLETISA